MIFTVSQLIILGCILLFILMNYIVIYLYQETYNSKEIKLKDSSVGWVLVQNISFYPSWWPKFKNVKNIEEHVQILAQGSNITLKIMIKNPNNKLNEVWSFYIKDEYTFIVKKQKLARNHLVDFLNKYLYNDLDLSSFCKSFKKIIAEVEQSIAKDTKLNEVKHHN
ncbi:hypothetical protein ABSA28_00445 [Candidatus Hepatincolaceae symbiont of Richtersius coronifer]